jgi:Sucrose-6F-phosphate phosphohydrolase
VRPTSCVTGVIARCDGALSQVRIIVSGISDWRYIDCVPVKGGKLEALEYVRLLFNIPRSRCVAAGDSGNDILMFEGCNLTRMQQSAHCLAICMYIWIRASPLYLKAVPWLYVCTFESVRAPLVGGHALSCIFVSYPGLVGQESQKYESPA